MFTLISKIHQWTFTTFCISYYTYSCPHVLKQPYTPQYVVQIVLKDCSYQWSDNENELQRVMIHTQKGMCKQVSNTYSTLLHCGSVV